MKYVLSGFFLLIHMAHWKSCLTFYQCTEYTITCTTAFRVHYEWVVIDWLTLDDDQEKWLIKMHFSTLSLSVWASLCIPAVCPYVYLVHHVVFNYPISHLYHWIRMSFKCPSGKCCHLTILPRTKNVKMYFKSGNSKLY